MSVRKFVLNGLFVVAIASCASLLACGGKKGNCEACSSNSDCESGSCTQFSQSGNQFLLCADNSTTTCSVPR
jgi:hypothetical protein